MPSERGHIGLNYYIGGRNLFLVPQNPSIVHYIQMYSVKAFLLIHTSDPTEINKADKIGPAVPKLEAKRM